MKKSTDGLEAASNETELEGNVDETQYMVMSRDQNGGGRHNIKITERAEQFKYLGTTLTNQNSIQEEIKSRMQSGNDRYHSVQNL